LLPLSKLETGISRKQITSITVSASFFGEMNYGWPKEKVVAVTTAEILPLE
jgi:hypothetical protein